MFAQSKGPIVWSALNVLVRKGGLEPPRFYPPDPKSGASANSATFAFLPAASHYCKRIHGRGPAAQNPGSAYGLSRPGNSLPLNGPSFPILVQFFPVKFFPLICLWRLYETLPTTPVSLLSLHYPNRAVDCRKCARFCP